MTIAQRDLNVPMILKPEDMCSPKLDERSLMTYISYFFKQNDYAKVTNALKG